MANDKRLASILFFVVVTAAASARAQTAPPAAPPTAPPAAPPDAAPASPPPTAAPGGDATRADALFQEGKRLLEQGKTDAACVLLAQSDAADPAVSTLGLLAACHEQQGRLATALKEYRETARRAAAAGDSRGDFAKQRAVELGPRVPRLVIRLAQPGQGIEISRNGEPVPASELGVEALLDPGSCEIVARAPGRHEYRAVVVVKEGLAVIVDIPELAPVAPVAPVAPPRPVVVPPPVLPPDEFAAKGSSARRPAGLIAGAVGLVGFGVGIGFGVSALNSNLESKTIYDTCKAPGAPHDACASGSASRGRAFSAATASTIGVGVGVAGVGTGLVLLLWPGRKAASPAQTGLYVKPLTGPDGGGAALGGAF